LIKYFFSTQFQTSFNSQLPISQILLPPEDTADGVAVGLAVAGRIAVKEIHAPRVRGRGLRGGPVVGCAEIISEAHSVGINTL
jgi:hypothetical protein